MTAITMLGTCMKCRARTAVHPCKVEAFSGEGRPIEATLCTPCVQGFKYARVTVRDAGMGEAMTQVYQ